MRKVLIGAFGLFLAATPAVAQDKPFEVNVGGGFTFPTTDFKNSFDMGGHFGIGGTFFFTPTLGVQVEYMYHKMTGPDKTITVFPTPNGGAGTSALIESNHQINSLIFDLVYRAKHSGMVGGYVKGGGGYYHRSVDLTTPAVGYTTVCDPYWYVCYPALVSTDQIIGSKSTDNFGINFGGGVTFGHNAKFYVETGYHYVWGPEVTRADGTKLTSNAAYFPLTFGFRF